MANSASLPNPILNAPPQVEPTPKCIEILKDESWMTFINDLFGGTSHICSLAGGFTATLVPYLSILSSPVYLYHAIKASAERFELMTCAFRASHVADTIFWFGRGVDSLGVALSDIIKPFAGGAVLLGLTHIPAIGLTFSFIIPIILIVLSNIGGTTQGWGMGRDIAALRKFHRKREDLGLEKFLHHLQGPSKQFKSQEEQILAEKHFNAYHFTSSVRREAIEERIEALLGFKELSKITEVREIISQILTQIGQPYIRPFNADTYFQHLDHTIDLSDQLLTLAREHHNPSMQPLIEALAAGREELNDLRTILHNEGEEISDTVLNEIHHKLTRQSIGILAVILTLIAGIIFLAFSKCNTVGYALALTSTTLSAIAVIYGKAFHRKPIKPTDPFLELASDDLF